MEKNLRTLLGICTVFGICLQSNKCFDQNSSRLFKFYIVLLTATLLFNCTLGISTNEILNELIISWIVSTIVFISQIFTHLTILYEAWQKQQEHADFIRLLQDIDIYFKILLKMDVGNSISVKAIRYNLIVLSAVSKLCLLVFAGYCLIYSDSGYFWWALLAILAMRFRFIQVIVYVEILKYYILALNSKLKQVVCLNTENSKQLLDIDYKHLQSVDILRNIQHIYASLYEASRLMNEFSQASLFAASASNFLDFICHIYWTLLAMDNFIYPRNIVPSMVTIFHLSFFILKFCYVCQIIEDECERTSLLLSRLLSCHVSPWLHRNYKSFVPDFCMQLTHQRIQFSGNRFFTFNIKFIFAICALIATHLIILIQFTKSDTTHHLNQTTEKVA